MKENLVFTIILLTGSVEERIFSLDTAKRLIDQIMKDAQIVEGLLTKNEIEDIKSLKELSDIVL